MDFLTGPCPKCGKQLQIPAELTEFSCLYCGTRMGRDDLLPHSAGSSEALLAQLGNCVTSCRDTISYLLPKKYAPRFEAFCDAHGQLLKTIDEVSPASFEAIAVSLVTHIGTWVAKNKRSLQREDSLLEDVRYTLCLLFVPAVQHLAPRQGKVFCEKLLQLWQEAYPKQTFQIVTFESIAGGFREHKLCFITTAVCTYQGKSDDCAELTAFRNFRDNWLRRRPFGKSLIRTYYRIAPALVTVMNVTEPDILYPALWDTYLHPCYDALQAGKFIRCRRLYTAMVRSLRKKYRL